jgi:acetylornithine deacetylase/succinyl-diaminopimelate desuccinylase-like protein
VPVEDSVLLDEILTLASDLVRIPTVTVGGPVRFDSLHRASDLIRSYLEDAGLDLVCFDEGEYPAILASFPGGSNAPVMICAHFDVVAPEPDDGQFEPYIDGQYFVGRGCGDMKTMVATLLVWMRRLSLAGSPYPPINLLLISNEEQGEDAPMGTPHILSRLAEDPDRDGYQPELLIAAERTGEKGDEMWGQICTQNRGAVRMKLEVHGRRSHSSQAGGPNDLVTRLTQARREILSLADKWLTLTSPDGWVTLVRFPFFLVGDDAIYNITAERGVMGLEIRPIPQDNVAGFIEEVRRYCGRMDISIQNLVVHPGISCDRKNPYLQALIRAVGSVSNATPVIGRKMAGTSARFAPQGQGIVWGQTGIDPHSRDERHFIPSILPFYKALIEFGHTAAEVQGETI